MYYFNRCERIRLPLLFDDSCLLFTSIFFFALVLIVALADDGKLTINNHF